MDDLYTLISNIAELDSELALLTAERDTLRAALSVLVEQHGGKISIPGLARAEIRAPVILESVDRGALSELVQSLRETGHAGIADEISRCTKKSVRAGSLVVVMERKAKA
jgi:hypothetical protein